MGLGFYIGGAIIWSLFMGLQIWNIYYSNKKQREENYSNYPAFLEKLKNEASINEEKIDQSDIDAIEEKYKNRNIIK
jgi:hypothetical protein